MQSLVPLKTIQSVEVFENTIYLAAWTDRAVVGLDKFTLKARVLLANVTRGTNFRIFHRQKQPEVAHPCRENNGNCNQICVPLWTRGFASAKCLCTAGYKLHNQTTCLLTAHDKFLVYTDKRLVRITGVPLDTEQVQQLEQLGEEPDVMVPIYNVTDPKAIDVNVRGKSILYVAPDPDASLSSVEHVYCIKSQSLNGSVSRTLSTGWRKVRAIAYDWVNEHLYWTEYQKLHVAPLRNMSKVLTFNIDCNPM